MTVRDFALILVAGALLLVPAAATVDVFNPDEPREIEIAREMQESRDLVVPHFNGCAFLEKPPLFYWLALVASRVPGISRELAARLPSILAALGLLLITYRIGRELFDRRTGRVGALLLLTSFQFWWLGKRAMLDMTLAFFVGAALLGFLLGHRRPGERARWFVLAGVAGAGALLTKGIIGVLIPALTVAVYLIWRRESRSLLSPPLIAAALIPLAAAGCWVALLATRPQGACYIREFLIENHVKRFLGGGYGGHRQPVWYYLESLATDLLPWVVFLPAALVSLWPGPGRGDRTSAVGPRAASSGSNGSHRGGDKTMGERGKTGKGSPMGEVKEPAAERAVRGAPLSARESGPLRGGARDVEYDERQDGRSTGGREGRGGRTWRDPFLHAWLLPSLVVLSLSSSKRSIYLLPLAPAVALLVAAWWRTRRRWSPRSRGGAAVLVPALILLVIGAVLAAALPAAVAILLSGREVASARDLLAAVAAEPAGIPMGIFLLVTVAAIAIAARRSPRRGAAGALLLVWTLLLIAGAALLPLAQPRLSARSLGRAIRVQKDSGVRVAACDLTEGSLGQFLFYSGGTLDWIEGGAAAAASPCVDCRLRMTVEGYLREPGARACLIGREALVSLPPDLRAGRILARGRVGGASYVLLGGPSVPLPPLR